MPLIPGLSSDKRGFRPSNDTSFAREKPTEWIRDMRPGKSHGLLQPLAHGYWPFGLQITLQYFLWYLLQHREAPCVYSLLIANYRLHGWGNLFMAEPARTWEQNWGLNRLQLQLVTTFLCTRDDAHLCFFFNFPPFWTWRDDAPWKSGQKESGFLKWEWVAPLAFEFFVRTCQLDMYTWRD